MIVVADEFGIRIGLRHQDRACAVTAAHIGGASAAPEFFGDAIERRKPARQQIGVIAGAEEALAAVEETFVVLAPFHALAGTKIFERAFAHMIQILYK